MHEFNQSCIALVLSVSWGVSKSSALAQKWHGLHFFANVAAIVSPHTNSN